MWGNSVNFLVVTFGVLIFGVNGVPLEMEKLTEEERAAIVNFREMAMQELTYDYMKEDVYLAKWLSKSGFNVQEALQKLREDLEWRAKNNMDGILGEDWEEMHAGFPYTRVSVDKMGRPLLYLDVEKWNIYQYLGKPESIDKLGRYLSKMFEESNVHVRHLREQGHNATQFNIIINMKGYNGAKHGCYDCVCLYRDIGKVLAANFPRSSEKAVFVNVSPMFRMVYMFLGTETQKYIKMFGRDRQEWEPFLLDYIEKDRIPPGLLSNEINY